MSEQLTCMVIWVGFIIVGFLLPAVIAEGKKK